MVRLASAALFLLLSAAAAANPAKKAPKPVSERAFQLPLVTEYTAASDRHVGRRKIGPNAHFGLGMFGLKADKPLLQPATGSELRSRKHRRAGIGISLGF